MLSFTSPKILGGHFEYSIARKPNNQYLLIFGRAYGMVDTREVAILNYTTQRSEKIQLSADNHPLIWLDSDVDRDERDFVRTPGGMLAALEAAEPPIIRPTGRVRKMRAEKGGEREAAEVEILLSEEDLGRICYYCRMMETVSDDRLERCGGEGHESVYRCQSVGF
ncbi:hypothetical protein CPB84DRAFT_1773713 [Gymnopilus junonius]|uniref:Uncharacterized protein n=1 Tax=Gymnopilus junonius TaxID=109634 RepID=A0A9P5NRE8_GYMJU|nr:hypothetical protein CPB84DRAFT_1773713 [Gymnopilus junonius]